MGNVRGGIADNEFGGFFDEDVAGDRVVHATAWNRVLKALGQVDSGVVSDIGEELAVEPTSPASQAVKVVSGFAWVGPSNDRHYYYNAADTVKPLVAAESQPRRDIIGVRLDTSLAERSTGLEVIKGAPSANPARPAIANPDYFEELAEVRVNANDVTQVAGDITDKRTYAIVGSPLLEGEYIVKSVNESVTNSSTLQDDDELFFAAEANSTYRIEIGLARSYNALSGANLKVRVDIPTDGDALMVAAHETGNNANSRALRGNRDLSTTGNDPANIEETAIFLVGFILIGITAGNVRVRWAQNGATSQTLTVLAGSYLRYEKIG